MTFKEVKPKMESDEAKESINDNKTRTKCEKEQKKKIKKTELGWCFSCSLFFDS